MVQYRIIQPLIQNDAGSEALRAGAYGLRPVSEEAGDTGKPPNSPIFFVNFSA